MVAFFRPRPIAKLVLSLVSLGALLMMGQLACADDVVINKNYPIYGPNGVNLSPPHVDVTNECATHVYVDSFVPGATIKVFLNGTTLVGGPTLSTFGFKAFALTQELHAGDKITATQTVNGVTSAPTNPPMVVGTMPSTLLPPQMGTDLYACGYVAPVHGLVSGVTVQVRDVTSGAAIGSGFTPNDWGDDWAPVGVSPLLLGHKITATQTACTGAKSQPSPAQSVNADPSPLTPPKLDPPVVGNDAVTNHGLFTGAVITIKQGPQIGDGDATAQTNWTPVSPDIAADPPAPQVTSTQELCTTSPPSAPQTPVTQLPPPTLIAPICVNQQAAIVTNSTINAKLVLLKNGVIVGYGGAAPGKVPLDISPPANFAQNDKVEVVEYIGNDVVTSNTVIVGCHDIITYHNDSLRTGWNAAENTLTPANVTPKTFGLIAQASLDDQVDAQPLIVTNQEIERQGVHSVAYVVTESNTVYAIDSFSGVILNHVNLGTAVPRPLNCENSAATVGINGTPTIDLETRTLYVIAYVMEGTTPTHRLHALNLSTLADRPGSPVKIAPSGTLKDGTTYSFNSSVQRQRPALLDANGNIYAAFGSYCDFQASKSRGWVLGWSRTTLAPLGAPKLLSRATTAPVSFDCYFHAPWTQNHPCFLSSVWMSGYGVAADAQGDLFFTTGNTAQGIYDSTFNIAESMVKLSGDLSSVLDFFTPNDVNTLDQNDTDFGSGGTLLLPDQPGNTPHLAVAAGKEGNLFIVNRDTGKMGELSTPNIPSSVAVGPCWCGPSYFTASDKVGRVVSSGGSQVMQWKVNTANQPPLSLEASASLPASGQDGGFFTSISSRGTTANTAIIWAVDRPVGNDNHLTLYAFDGTASGSSLKQLWSADAGTWPNANATMFGGANANIVPTVANGMVYVASYKKLMIFGLRPKTPFRPRREPVAVPPVAETVSLVPDTGAMYWGTVRSVDANRLTLELRTGRTLTVDMGHILPQGRSSFEATGQGLAVNGTMGPDGVFIATGAWRTKGQSLWGDDRE
jgi:hypothetical protein